MGPMGTILDSPGLPIAIHILIVVAIGVRVVMNRPATGVALAWLFLVAAVPYGGVFFYLLFGERRVRGARAQRIAALRPDFEDLTRLAMRAGMTDVDWERHRPAAQAMSVLGMRLIGAPTVCGSHLELISDTGEILKSIAADVDTAERSVLMEFYIWNEGGLADEVLEALIRAAERGVECRLLVDALGAAAWWKGRQPARLRDAGVQLRKALPVGIVRMIIGRNDVRVHRKIVIIDG